MLHNKERKENKMEKYNVPEIEIIRFESEDVITVSEPELELQ